MSKMNRLAIHETAAGDLSPHELIGLAHRSGFHSVGLRVSHSPGATRWWQKGAGAEELGIMIDRLLATRISVLDVGRIDLGAETAESGRNVLDLASRLGARHVTAVAPPGLGHAAAQRLFGLLVAQADSYGLVPLLVPQAGTAVDTEDCALAIHREVGGGVVLNISAALSAAEVEMQVVDAGNRLGYLRLLAEELDAATEEATAGLLATVPAHVPVAVGSLLDPEAARADLDQRAPRWAALIDRMLEHPRARAERFAAATAR